MKLKSAILKDALDLKGTQEEVAAALGMSIATVNNAVNGGECHRSTAVALCDFLDVELARAVVPRAGADQGKDDAA